MGDVTLPADHPDLDRVFPSMCAKTGGSADHLVRMQLSWQPSWVLLLILFGVLPFLIAAYFTQKKSVFHLPASDATFRSLRRTRWTTALMAVVGVAAFVVGASGPSLDLVTLGVFLLIAAGVVAAIGKRIVWVTGRRDETTITLRGVHDSFAVETRKALR